jgi:hypothetical protein
MTRVPVDRKHKSWGTQDRKHAGWVGALFGDGAISIGLGPVDRPQAGFQLGYDADGTDLEDLGICRGHAEVTGWIGVCTCGWRSRPWARVATPPEEDLAARRVYGGFFMSDGRLFDVDNRAVCRTTLAEWRQHIEPDGLLALIGDLTEQRRQLDERLARLVAQAREVGVTWEDIGRAAGVTRQSAHERWSRTVPTTTAATRDPLL